LRKAEAYQNDEREANGIVNIWEAGDHRRFSHKGSLISLTNRSYSRRMTFHASPIVSSGASENNLRVRITRM
jgi:hypothetical protein